MTMRFVDSFDHYDTADFTQKWTVRDGGTNAPVISAGNGRRATSSARLASNSQGLSKTLDAQATWIVGHSLRAAAFDASLDRAILSFIDVATIQVDIRVRPDGTIRATRNGTTLATSTNALSTATIYHIETKVVIDPSAGSVEVRVNGSSTGWINITGQNTRASANSSANIIRLTGITSTGGGADFDDLIICDGNGSTNNNFIGDARVDVSLPSGNGNSSQLVGSDSNSVDNYQLVDEALTNGDTDYVQSATVGNKDTYEFADISHTPSTIFGVQLCMASKKDDSGSRSICSVTRSGGSDTDGTAQALSTSYACYRQILENDPNTAAAWTRTNLNAAEFGVKVAA